MQRARSWPLVAVVLCLTPILISPSGEAGGCPPRVETASGGEATLWVVKEPAPSGGCTFTSTLETSLIGAATAIGRAHALQISDGILEITCGPHQLALPASAAATFASGSYLVSVGSPAGGFSGITGIAGNLGSLAGCGISPQAAFITVDNFCTSDPLNLTATFAGGLAIFSAPGDCIPTQQSAATAEECEIDDAAGNMAVLWTPLFVLNSPYRGDSTVDQAATASTSFNFGAWVGVAASQSDLEGASIEEHDGDSSGYYQRLRWVRYATCQAGPRWGIDDYTPNAANVEEYATMRLVGKRPETDADNDVVPQNHTTDTAMAIEHRFYEPKRSGCANSSPIHWYSATSQLVVTSVAFSTNVPVGGRAFFYGQTSMGMSIRYDYILPEGNCYEGDPLGKGKGYAFSWLGDRADDVCDRIQDRFPEADCSDNLDTGEPDTTTEPGELPELFGDD